MADERKDPYAAFGYKVEIDGIVEAGFSECSGLQVETEVEEVRECGLNEYVYRLPKGNKHVNLTLKRGLTDSRKLWDWHREVVQSADRTKKLQRRTVSVILQNSQGEERWRWLFKEA